MRNEKSCGCIIFNERKEVLLIQMLEGHWSFPKGHVEANETERQTALREVKEETNIRCNIIDGYRYISTYSPIKGVLKNVIYFLALTDGSMAKSLKKQEEEIKNIGFYCVENAMEIVTFDEDKNALLLAVKFLEEKNKNRDF